MIEPQTEPVVPVAHCYKCGAETQMSRNSVPICPTCLALLKAESKLGLNETL
jgi:hypothetical protein